MLFALWSLFHIQVAVSGYLVFAREGNAAQWRMLSGRHAVPDDAHSLHPDEPAALAQSHLILNFITDVGGYGLLGLIVAFGLFTNNNAWLCYMIGAFVIGIADIAYLFLMVLPGIVEPSMGSVIGPILWTAALAITPMGLTPPGAPPKDPYKRY